MHLEAVIVHNSKLYWCEFGDSLGGCDQASLEMHLEAGIVRSWRP